LSVGFPRVDIRERLPKTENETLTRSKPESAVGAETGDRKFSQSGS